jgi:carbamate kinase
MAKTAVVALGGNAITREFEEGDVYQQFANTRRALVGIADMAEMGYHIAITHGNGPQVGNALIRVEETRKMVPPVPLGVLVADLSGGMGYMIEQTMQNKLRARNVRRHVVTLLAQVIVDKDDPSIHDPSKFVGPFYEQEQVEELVSTRGYVIKKDSTRGYRRVVPSPIPKRIVEEEVIRDLVRSGVIVITCGGGGIPVYVEEDHRLEGIDGVVDKDRASAILAHAIGAEELYILTAVEKVAIKFGTRLQKDLDHLTVEQARTLLQAGEFPAGSMGPKIRAAVDFLETGGTRAMIGAVEQLPAMLNGENGTEITATRKNRPKRL